MNAVIEFRGVQADLSARVPYDLALKRSQEARINAGQDPHARGCALLAEGECLRRLGFLKDSHAALKEGLEIFRSCRSPREQARGLWMIGNLWRQQDNLTASTAALAAGLEQLAAAPDHHLATYLRAGIAENTRIQGRYPLAARQHRRLATDFVAIGSLRGQAWALQGLAQIMRNTGSLRRAEALFKISCDLARAVGDSRGEAYGLRGQGEVLREGGAYGMAKPILTEAKRRFAMGRCRIGEGYAARSLGDLHAASGDFEGALAAYREATVVFTHVGHERGLAYVSSSAARLLARLSNRDHAVEVGRRALSWFRQRSISLGRTETARQLSRLNTNPHGEIAVPPDLRSLDVVLTDASFC